MTLRLRLGLRGLLLASALTLPVLPIPARAADVTAAQAQDVAKDLQAWLSTLLGGKVPLPPDLFKVTPAGELFRLTLPVPPAALRMEDGTGKATDALYTIGMRPLGGTRWAIEEFRMPAFIALSAEAAGGLASGLAQSSPSTAAPSPGGKPNPPNFEIRIRSQNATGVYDTALKTESRLEVNTQGISVRSTGMGSPGQRSEGNADRFTGVFQLRPTTSGGVDTISDWTMEGYSSVNFDPSLGDLKFGARRVRMRGEIGAVMTAQFTTILQTAIQGALEASAQPKPTPDAPLSDANRAKLKTIVTALKGIIAGMGLEETIEGFRLEAMGQNGGADRVLFALGGGAPGGKFGAFLELGVDGLKVSGIPPQFAQLLPRSISLRPVVSNIDVVALTALADAALEPKADFDAIQGKLLSLFTANGVKVGVERLSIDLGSTKLSASGSVTPVSPNSANGKAEIFMTGYDALMDRVQKMPEAAQGIPVLALLRGLARTEGDKLVWRLELTEDQKITVNGVDLRKLGGH